MDTDSQRAAIEARIRLAVNLIQAAMNAIGTDDDPIAYLIRAVEHLQWALERIAELPAPK